MAKLCQRAGGRGTREDALKLRLCRCRRDPLQRHRRLDERLLHLALQVCRQGKDLCALYGGDPRSAERADGTLLCHHQPARPLQHLRRHDLTVLRDRHSDLDLPHPRAHGLHSDGGRGSGLYRRLRVLRQVFPRDSAAFEDRHRDGGDL